MHDNRHNAEPGYAGLTAVRIIPYAAWHLHLIHEQDAEAYWTELVKNPQHAHDLEASGPAYTAVRGDDEILACAGVIPQWEGRAIAWAIMAREIKNDYITVHRGVKNFLDNCGFRRVETTVDCGFEKGVRWARMLGFKNETPLGMRGYAPDGRPHFLFARVICH